MHPLLEASRRPKEATALTRVVGDWARDEGGLRERQEAALRVESTPATRLRAALRTKPLNVAELQAALADVQQRPDGHGVSSHELAAAKLELMAQNEMTSRRMQCNYLGLELQLGQYEKDSRKWRFELPEGQGGDKLRVAQCYRQGW